MEPQELKQSKPLECPVPEGKRHVWLSYIKRLGVWGFMFFLVKGLTLYVLLPYLIAKGYLNFK